MKRIPLLLAALALSACAGLPLASALLGSRMSVKVPAELPFPDALTLELDPAYGGKVKLLSLLGGVSLEKRLGALVKEQSRSLRVGGAKAFRQELEAAAPFGQVVDEGGNVGLAVGVSRFGLAWDPQAKSYGLVLDLQASLSEPHLGVVWRGTRTAKDLGADVKKLASKVDVAALLAEPQALDDLGRAAVRDLSRQLLADMEASLRGR